MESKRWAGPPALALTAIGFGVSYYLFGRGVKLAATGDAGADFCSTVFQTSCDSTLLSEYSKFLGLSFAGWGAVYFLTVGALVLLSMLLRDIMHRQALSGALVMNAGGLIVSGYLSWLLLSGTVAFCPLCLFTHVINLLLLPTLLLYRGGGIGDVKTDIGKALNYVFSGRPLGSAENVARSLAFIAAILLGAAAYEWFLLRAVPAPSAMPAQAGPGGSNPTEGEMIDNLMAAYFDNQPVEIPVGPSDPREGPEDAPVQLVVFSDFECPSCKSNSAILERMAKLFGDQISIVFKNYPLSSTCNPNISSNPHQFACLAAYAGVAAHMQGKYVPFHDLIYRLKDAPTPPAIEYTAQQVGLDLERLRQDMNSDAARGKIRDDIALATQLKVVQTPTMYINGRLITSPVAPHIGIVTRELLAGRTPAGVGD